MGETRKLAAILVADVVGYSRLAGADEDRTLARLRGLRSDLIDPAIAAHHGRIVKRTGDGSIIEFRSVVDAVRCAIEVQNGMVERNGGLPPEKRIEFRVGIHVGDVVEESDGDLMGDGVNVAARLEGVAKPGAICLSEQAYWQVKTRLDLKVSDLGATQLKNIAEPVHVYSVEVGQSAEAKPTSAATAAVKPEREAPVPRASGWSSRWPALAAIAALILLAATGGWSIFGGRLTKPAQAPRLSIVVLPFANLSGDPAQDYLANSMTDELTTALARIRDSFVIARNTAFTYKSKPVDAKAIGKDLGVRYVLEGSALPSATQVRVNAQLIDADSGAQLWADQFDAARTDLLQMQDEVVTRLARAMDIQLPEAEAARLKRAPAANPDAEDLALQCVAAVQKSGYVGKDDDAGSGLCEKALSIDPNNVRALAMLSIKIYFSVISGSSADMKVDFKRAEELASRGLALDPNYASAHYAMARVLNRQGRFDEAIAENERALALDPAMVAAYGLLGLDYMYLGEFEKSLEFSDKAIRLSPHDPSLVLWYNNNAGDYFGLKQYDQAIEWARRAIAINSNGYPWPHFNLIPALALTGREAEAHEALLRYLALVPTGPKTIAAWKAIDVPFANFHTDPRFLESLDRRFDGLRKAGVPEE